MNATTKTEAAKKAAAAKISKWADVQMRAAAKKLAARARGDEKVAAVYFRAEVQASSRRSRHEDALVKLDRMEREAAELAAWNARRAK